MTDYATEIISNFLFLGSMWATIPSELQTRQIDCVLNVACQECDANRGQYALKRWLILNLDDTPEQAQHLVENVLPQAFAMIDECWTKRQRLLVHCAAGNSRSASVVIAWLMHNQGLSYEAALAFVQSKRPTVRPNAGFLEALKKM